MKTINYNYYNFGPFLYSTKLTDDEVKTCLDICEKQKGENVRYKLAGHLKEQFDIPTNAVMGVLRPYFESYCKALYETRNQPMHTLKMSSAWVNYMKAGEFNPPHIHSKGREICTLSCVLYLNVPDDMTKEEHIGNSNPPGSISFMYGESLEYNIAEFCMEPKKGDFYIFPGWLRHCVFPFRSKGTRISVSANLEQER